VRKSFLAAVAGKPPLPKASEKKNPWPERTLQRESPPPRRKGSPGMPWGLWVTFVVLVILLVVAHRLFPPGFEHSPPELELHGTTLSVEFDVINHTRESISEDLSVRAGNLSFSKSGASLTPRGHQELSVTLAPAEKKRMHCNFPDFARFSPNGAEVSVLQH